MSFIDKVIESAYRHGFDSELDMEVGDLQSLARDLWKILTPAQRKTFAADPTWRDFVEMWPTRPTPILKAREDLPPGTGYMPDDEPEVMGT